MIEEINYLSDKGFRIAIDDFGCGFSSLCLLKDLNISVLKLDRGFLKDYNEKSYAIVKSVVDLAKSLNIEVVAEGVETEEMYNFVKEIGCDYAQGYLYAKPMPIAEFERYLLNFQK